VVVEVASLAAATARKSQGYAACPGFKPRFIRFPMGRFGEFYE
jgi:hypothetical protein